VSDGESVTSYRSHYKALRCCYGFANVFNVFLITSTFRGKYIIRLQCGLLTYPCGVLSMWGFVHVGLCPMGFCPCGLLSGYRFIHTPDEVSRDEVSWNLSRFKSDVYVVHFWLI